MQELGGAAQWQDVAQLRDRKRHKLPPWAPNVAVSAADHQRDVALGRRSRAGPLESGVTQDFALVEQPLHRRAPQADEIAIGDRPVDRKSTRLNSSHPSIS